MDFSSPPRPRVRGKPFKLFTDDLPRIDFNRSHLRDIRREGPSVEKRIPPTHVKRQNELNQDKLSLPSIESPDWDNLSTPEPNRPRSHVNILNPNIAQLNKKIRRRHTVRESCERVVLDERFRRANDDIHVSVKLDPETVAATREKTGETVKEAFVRTSSTRSFRSKSSKGGDVEDKTEPEKPKSILQQLLDASARDSARRKMVEEGFKLFRQEGVKRRDPVAVSGDVEQVKGKETNHNVKISKPANNDAAVSDKENSKRRSPETKSAENKVFSVIKENSEESKLKDVKTKPGILKYNLGTPSTKIKHEHNLKPRLIHHDNIKDLPREDVKVTVHAEAPMNRLNALIFARAGSHKPRTRRRVNFDNVEENSVLEPDEVTETGTDKAVFDEEYRIDSSLNNDTTTENDLYPRPALSLVRKRDSIRRKSKNRTPELKTPHISSFTSYNRDAHKEGSPTGENVLQFEKLTENLRDPRADPFWKDMKESPMDVRPSVNETLNNRLVTGDVTPELNAFRVPSNFSRKIGRRGKVGLNNRKLPQSPTLFTPSDTVSTPTTGSIFGNSDFDSLPDMQSFFEEMDVDGFPDEIDRSLLGEDLIKAYRLWDRKRKAFPGGLRKIEAPSDQSEDVLLSKALGAVRTYKISPQTQEMKTSSAENKEPLTSVVIGTF